MPLLVWSQYSRLLGLNASSHTWAMVRSLIPPPNSVAPLGSLALKLYSKPLNHILRSLVALPSTAFTRDRAAALTL